MENNKTVFVFYSFGEKSTNWTYGRLPKGWSWTGAGGTSPIGKPPLPYTNEEQFDGPKETQTKMREYLDNYFKKLKSRKIIKKYRIRNSYMMQKLK